MNLQERGDTGRQADKTDCPGDDAHQACLSTLLRGVNWGHSPEHQDLPNPADLLPRSITCGMARSWTRSVLLRFSKPQLRPQRPNPKLPDGQISKAVSSRLSSPRRKNISLFGWVDTALKPDPSRPDKGAFRDRHGRETGCGGRGGVTRRMTLRADGEVVAS
jgi:hypothetical protein